MSVTSNRLTNREVVVRFFEDAFNNGNYQLLREIIDDDHVSHLPTGDHYGPEGVRIDIACFRAAFPDLHLCLDDLIETDDHVAYRFTAEGTHTAPFMGLPASGRPIRVNGIGIDRLRAGKTVERWVQYDSLGLLMQLGVIAG